MTPTRDTDPDSLGAAVVQEAKKYTPKLVAALSLLLMAAVGYWTYRITAATVEAKDAAENAEAKGEQGAATAKKVKVENQAGYDVVKEKADATGDVIAELAAELKALRVEVEALKAARSGRRPRRPPAVKVPAAVTEPLPPTPAAAAAQETQP